MLHLINILTARHCALRSREHTSWRRDQYRRRHHEENEREKPPWSALGVEHHIYVTSSTRPCSNRRSLLNSSSRDGLSKQQVLLITQTIITPKIIVVKPPKKCTALTFYDIYSIINIFYRLKITSNLQRDKMYRIVSLTHATTKCSKRNLINIYSGNDTWTFE